MSKEKLNPNAEPAESERDPGWMTKKEVARLWKQSVKTIERRIAEKKLAVHRFGKRVRIALRDVLAFENSTGGHCV